MPRKIRCHCGGKESCLLCKGVGKYQYTPGHMGYMPFNCPTCEGKRNLSDEDGTIFACMTCNGQGMVDPANPPNAGLLDILSKILFGA